MKTNTLIYGCCILQLLACQPATKNAAVAEKQLLEADVSAMQADLMRQGAEMDSLAALEELEVAQQIILQQQLMDLKAKMNREETRLNPGLVSNSLKNTPDKP